MVFSTATICTGSCDVDRYLRRWAGIVRKKERRQPIKVQKILMPLARSLAPGGRLLAIQSCGHDPGLEIIQQLWPEERPFQVGRHELVSTLRRELGRDARDFIFPAQTDEKALMRYEMHTLPSEIGDRIGTSTLFAAWNAAIYVNQIEDERLDPVVQTGAYLEATQQVLQKYGGLWFNDETFVMTRRRLKLSE